MFTSHIGTPDVSKRLRLTRKSLVIALSIGLLMIVPGAAVGDDRDHGQNTVGKLVVVGDSLTAGFQNFSLFDSNTAPSPGGQQFGYANLVARQAGVNFPQRLVTYPGIPPALKLSNNTCPISLTSDCIVRAAGIGAPENLGVLVQNLSVSGFSTGDILAHAFPGNPAVDPRDAMSDIVLGAQPAGIPGCGPIPAALLPFPIQPPVPPSALGVSEVLCAAALAPNTILLSAGSNDALQSLIFGIPPTDPAVFATQYHTLFSVLAGTGANIVASNVPDVSAVPFLMSVGTFKNQCGTVPLGPPGYTVTNADFVVPDLNPALPTFNICKNYGFRPAALIAQVRTSTAAYNQIISANARQFGAGVLDLNGLFDDIAEHGYEVGDQRITVAFGGGIFSLDGIHPTNTGYAIIANEAIKTLNRRFGMDLQPLSIRDIAKNDPLFQRIDYQHGHDH